MAESTLFKKILTKKVLMPVGVLVVLGSWFTWYVWHWEHREPFLEVYFLDVAKGSAIFVRTPHGKTALIGGGQGSDIIRKLTTIMPFYRRKIDTVIYTADPANAIGLADVLGRYDVAGDHILHMSATSSPPIHATLDEIEGNEIRLDESGGFLRLSYGGSDFMLADSVSRKDQEALVSPTSSKLKVADVIQIRSAAQTRVSTNFFNLIRPKYLVVSKTPSRPKPKAEPVAKPAKVVVVKAPVKTAAPTTKKTAPSTKKISKSPAKQKKPTPPKDPPFDPFSYPSSSLHILGLDQKGTVEFISDGKSLRMEASKK
jgi:hypothetical protein